MYCQHNEERNMKNLHEALDAILAFDEQRQRTGRVPKTKAERLASDVIGHLSGVKDDCWPEISALSDNASN
jgi:hypothetical protein